MPVKPISLDDALEVTRTGDVWLFRGRTVADRAIQMGTNSPVNHVGMSVTLDDLPPLMWHAELGRSLPDLWAGGHHRGVQLHDLRAAVTVWTTRYGQQAWLRQLDHQATPEAEDAVLRTIARLDGTPFPSNHAAGHPVAARAAAGSAARVRDQPGVGILRRGGRRHLPGYGAAAGQPPAELVRPGPVLERRRPRPARRRPTRRRDRRAHPAHTTAGTAAHTLAVTRQHTRPPGGRSMGRDGAAAGPGRRKGRAARACCEVGSGGGGG